MDCPVETVFLKLGGSLLTNKTAEETVRIERIESICTQIATVRAIKPHLRLLLGIGSGSFGHFPAAKYRLFTGADHPEAWMGAAITADSAARLVRVVVAVLLAQGVKAWSFQPGSSWIAKLRQLQEGSAEILQRALANGLVPIVHGDVMLDTQQQVCIVSTEEVFRFLIPGLQPQRVLLAGEVPGLMVETDIGSKDAKPISHINRLQARQFATQVGTIHGVDVTGGMRSKLEACFTMVESRPTNPCADHRRSAP